MLVEKFDQGKHFPIEPTLYGQRELSKISLNNLFQHPLGEAGA